MTRTIRFRRRASALALALALSATAARAEEAGDDRNTIIVNAELAGDAAAAQVCKRPGGVDVVEAAAFADRLAVSLGDALAFSPGVYSQPRFGQEVRLSIRGSGISRGFHMRGLTLLQDGIPINLADDNGDFQELDPQVFERIEVYRGANALRHGGSTLGGAINAVTPTGRTAPRFELRVDGGSFSTVRAKAAAAFADERGDAYLALTSDRSDGDRQHAARRAIRFNGNAAIRLGGGVETRFYAALNHIRQELPGTLTVGQALATPARSLPANISGDQARDIDSIRLQNRTTIELGRGMLAIGGFYNAKALFHPIFQVIDQKADDRGLFANLDLGGKGWELTLGSQARFGKVKAKQFLNVAGERGMLTADLRQSAYTISSHAELRLKPVDRLTLIGGAVHSVARRRVINRRVPARSGEADFDSFSPKIGLLYEPDPMIQLYANTSRSVEFPGYSELSQIPATGLPGFAPVGAQRAWTFEAGTRGQRGIARWDISVYRADLKGEMLQYAIGPDIPAATFNAGKTRHQGIEAGLELRLMPWARLRQVYQLNDFRFRGDIQFRDNRLPVVPRHQYRAELRLGSDRLGVSPHIEWTPSGPWIDYQNTKRAPGYVLFGIRAEAELREGVSLFADARNLGGRRAIGDVSAIVRYVPDNPATAADESSVTVYPVERRAIYAGVRARF